MRDAELVEQLAARGRVDKAARIVRRVAVLTAESSNGRGYSVEALADCARLIEGVKVFDAHDLKQRAPGETRPAAEWLGVLRNGRVEGATVYADLHYAPHAAVLLEGIAENFAEGWGLSIHGFGSTKARGGRTVVTGLSRIQSVDLTSDPASTRGLFESVRGSNFEAMAGEYLAAVAAIGQPDPFLRRANADLQAGLAVFDPENLPGVRPAPRRSAVSDEEFVRAVEDASLEGRGLDWQAQKKL